MCICSLFKIHHLGWGGGYLMNMQIMVVQLIDYENSAPLPTLSHPLSVVSFQISIIALHRASKQCL